MPSNKQRPETTARAALLGAARALFAERGFDGAGTREIADRASVRQGLVRHHFGSKEALWREVVTTGLVELAVAVSHAAPDAGAGVPEWAAGLGQACLEQREVVQLIVHALLEPGTRRAWLLSQLSVSAPVTALVARVHATNEREPSAEASALIALRAIVVCATPLLAATWRALSGNALDVQSIARVQREVWVSARATTRAVHAPGPWSLAAAAQRRADAQRRIARVARDS